MRSRVQVLIAVAAVLAAPGLASAAPSHGGHPHVVIAKVLSLPGAAASSAVSARIGPRYRYAIPRATVDRPDVVHGRQIHVVYLLPSDVVDEALDTLGVIDMSMNSQNAWFARQSGGQRWVYDTAKVTVKVSGKVQTVSAVDVTFLRTTQPASAYSGGLAPVVDELKKAGLSKADKRYLVYAATPTGGECGSAYYPLLSADGQSPVDGQYSAVYLDSDKGCSARDFATSVSSPGVAEAIIQQEMIHNDGIVPVDAVHDCVPANYGHVCTGGLAIVLGNLDPESADVMFPYITGKGLAAKVLDRGHDDYYQAALATHDLRHSYYLTH